MLNAGGISGRSSKFAIVPRASKHKASSSGYFPIMEFLFIYGIGLGACFELRELRIELL